MSEWENITLGEFGTFTNGINKDKGSFGYGNPFVNLLDIYGKASISRTPKGLVKISESEIKIYDLKKGDVLFARSSVKPEGVGQSCVVLRNLERVVYSGFIIRFRQFSEKLWYLYSKYCFDNKELRRSILAKSTVSANTNINQESLKTVQIKLPPLPHQRKIAHILTTVDNIIEKTESAIEKYKAIKQGMMHDLFTRGIDVKTGKLRPSYEDAPELYRETELGMIPKEWAVKRLEDFVYMRSGDGITSESIEVMGDYPVYGGNGLRGYAKKYTHSGDFVLIGRQGALCGNVFRARGKFFASEHAVVVTILDSSNVDWLGQKLKYMKLNKYSEASAQPGLAVTKLLSLSVALPKENEQNEVSKRLLILNSKLKIEQTALSKYQKIKQALMQDLLTGKKEVTPDPEDFETANNE